MVDVRFTRMLRRFLPLDELKSHKDMGLAGMPLFSRSRCEVGRGEAGAVVLSWSSAGMHMVAASIIQGGGLACNQPPSPLRLTFACYSNSSLPATA